MSIIVSNSAKHARTSTLGVIRLAVLILTSSLVLSDDRAAVYAQETCGSALLTTSFTSDSFYPSIDSLGNRIAFVSRASFVGNNQDGGTEVFLFEPSMGSFIQITSDPDGDSSGASISSDGANIAFSSTANINGGNPDNNSEIFLYYIDAQSFTQITNTAIPSLSFGPAINSNGKKIAFSSSADLTGDNPDNSLEIFLFDTDTQTYIQITDTASGLYAQSSINADGSLIAFESDALINGLNADGNSEVFLYDTKSQTLTQVTNSLSGNNFDAFINANGTMIAFTSSSNLTGSNADGNSEVFLYDTEDQSITQISDTTSGDNLEPSLNEKGNIIAFSSSSNLTGENPDSSSEIFLFRSEDSSFIQLSNNATEDSTAPSIDGLGVLVAYQSVITISQIYRGSCRPDVVVDPGIQAGCSLTNKPLRTTAVVDMLVPTALCLLALGILNIRRKFVKR